jgi:hypothetical protein
MSKSKRPSVALCWAVGVLGLGSLTGCQGQILDGAEGGRSSGPDKPGKGGSGGNAMTPPNSSIPDVVDPNTGKPCSTTTFTGTRIWRLSDEQYATAISDLLPGVTPTDISTPGRNGTEFIDFAELPSVNAALLTDLRGSVEEVAKKAVSNLNGLLGCPGDAACIRTFIERFGARAFRRPLEPAEKSELEALYTSAAADGAAEGLRVLLTAILQSPSFLYRTELGKGGSGAVELTPHELASSLSFFLLNSIPDAELWASANDGSLMKTDAFKAQVDRLMRLPRVQQNLARIMIKWVGLRTGINPDLADKYQELTPELKASLEEETRLFFSSIVSKHGTVGDVLTSTRGFVDRNLARHYGLPSSAVGATGFTEYAYPAQERAGILTQGAILARYSLGNPVVFRGKYVRQELLCGEMPDPPNIPAVEEESTAAADLPEREQVKRRLAHPICGSCHSMMDPIGLAFSNYDALARYRTSDAAGKAIDGSANITNTDDLDGPVMNAVDLAQKLARSKAVQACIQEKMYSYALGRMTAEIDSCELKRIDAYLTGGGGKMAELFTGIIYSSAFRFRTGGS